jgi:hypothetical protein
VPGRVAAEEREPERVTGVVKRVLIEYRIMRGWGVKGDTLVPMASVFLDNYEAVLFPRAALAKPE